MTSYAELDRIRKQARPLYLGLRALGLNITTRDSSEDPIGYVIFVEDLRLFSDAHADRIRRLVEEHKPGLVEVQRSWHEDLDAIREEGRV